MLYEAFPNYNPSCLFDYNNSCNLMNMKLNERVKAAREYAGMTQEEMVEKIKDLPGVESFTQQALDKLELGMTKKSAFIIHIAHLSGINPQWLAFGQGNMLDQKFTVADTKAKYDVNDEGLKKITKAYFSAPPETREDLANLMVTAAGTKGFFGDPRDMSFIDEQGNEVKIGETISEKKIFSRHEERGERRKKVIAHREKKQG